MRTAHFISIVAVSLSFLITRPCNAQSGIEQRAATVLRSMFSPLATGEMDLRRVSIASLPGTIFFAASRTGPHSVRGSVIAAVLPDSSVLPLGNRIARQVLLSVFADRLERQSDVRYAIDLAILDGAIPFDSRLVSDTSAVPAWARRQVELAGIRLGPPVRSTTSAGLVTLELHVWAEALWFVQVTLASHPWYDQSVARLVLGDPPG